ncbi:TonB-dependent receptor [Sphingomonas ginkgonis]|uniref:TonB-dependent receptor n=1 Tax=Sphingomonas ginkgonis TaxID=2315330 RepID=A0A3S0ENQ7_9SPHN|nr:TonB-dependent receptor [Sphingomonas ginkgonis]RST31749.1 TonB-dependent receptor [Sphingomonas ginkgonis]
MKKLVLLSSTAAMFVAPSMAFAQSTGTTATENSTIVITGTRTRSVNGVVVPDVPKTRSVLTQEILNRQSAGQSILQSINLIPGVNYTNTDPYGSAGGNLRIRGFPGNRVAFLWDGLPLNDTGNYAIFGNQQMDQELIDQVSVNLGTTDVDSPTPSAAGGVVSYRTRVPSTNPGGMIRASLGDFAYRRIFGLLDTGSLTSWGTRAFISGSAQKYDKFKGPGVIDKKQVNARVYQPLGGNGDFVSLAGHYNRNRNNSYNSGAVADYLTNRYFDNIGLCVRDAPTTGVRDNDNSGTSSNNSQPASCTNYYNLRINPSDTWNLRGSMKISLTDNLTFTADPGYQHTLANGGGTTVIAENDSRLRDVTGGAAGVDLNGDGDILDINNTTSRTTLGGIRVYSPNNTRTRRYTFLSSLIWQVAPQHRFRLAYTFDRGDHRQTGEYGNVDLAGNPLNPFSGKVDRASQILTQSGAILQVRNRKSIAQLQQVSGEYFGRFFDNRVTVTAGIRAPFFRRELNQYCYTSNGDFVFGGTAITQTDAQKITAGGLRVTAGNPYCTAQANPILPGATLANPTAGNGVAYFAPFSRTVKYSPILPSAGASFNITKSQSVYVSFGKNFSSPSTDNLYRSVVLNPSPETTNNYEAGYRFTSGVVQAQLATYYVNYKNRIVSAQDLDPASPTFGSSIDRNVGNATAYGFDGQLAIRPLRSLSLYGYASYIHSELKQNITRVATQNVALTTCPSTVPAGQTCQVVDVFTKGAQFVETPKWQFGGRVQKDFGPLSIGGQFKHVGSRYATDDNGAVGTIANVGTLPIDNNGKLHSYNLVDLDAVLHVPLGGSDKPNADFRVGVTNLFNKYYFGNISTATSLAGGTPRFSVGAPRTFQVSGTFSF